MNFEQSLKEIIEDNFLEQPITTPFLNEQTVQFKIAVELFKRLGIEVQLEKCFSPFDSKKDYLDIYYESSKIGIELKYKLKSVPGFPYLNQSAQNNGSYGFFMDICRLEKLVLEKKLNTGYAVIITNDSIYTKNRRGNIKDFSITIENCIVAKKEYLTSKWKTAKLITFKQNYSNFEWFTKTTNSNMCKFYCCIMKIVKSDACDME